MSNWTSNNIPDQSGRVVIITGANSGIGFEAAKALAEKGAEVILAVRDQGKGDAAIASIQAELPEAKLQVRLLDLVNLASVNAFAKKFNADFNQLDLLINNAGIMAPPHAKTVDGFESQLGTNHLGHFALTAQLFELLRNTPASRIVNVSSNAHKMGKLNFDDLHWENRRYSAWRAYGDSKIANLYFTSELSRKIQENGNGMAVIAAHPGLTVSELAKGAGVKFFVMLFGQKTPIGALPTLMAATEPSAKNGEYFGPAGFAGTRGYPGKSTPNDLAKDAEIAEQLWRVSEEMTGVSFQI